MEGDDEIKMIGYNSAIGRIRIEIVLNEADVRIGLLWLVGVRYAQSTEEFL